MSKVEKYLNISSLIFLCAYIFLFMHPININSFFHSDYYINYSNCFIRRGLDGQSIYLISEITKIFPWKIQKFYSIFFLILFCVLIIYSIFKYKIPLYIIFSGSCFFLFIYGNTGHIKKDHIIATLYIINILLIKKSEKIDLRLVLLQNILLLIGTCIHELFYFYSIFPIIFSYIIKFQNQNIVRDIIKLTLLPSIFFILICSIFRGNIDDANMMANSWEHLGLSNIRYGRGIFDGTLYIWKSNFDIWTYLFLIIILLSHFLYNYQLIFNKYQNSLFKYLLIAQTLVCILMIIVATDFSRWIFFTFFTFYFCFYIIKKETSPISDEETRHISILTPIIYLFLTMPFTRGNMFSAYYDLMPITVVFKSIKKLELLF